MISLLLFLIVIGVCLYLVETLPISPPFKIVIRVLAVVFCIILLLRAFGIADVPVINLRN